MPLRKSRISVGDFNLSSHRVCVCARARVYVCVRERE